MKILRILMWIPIIGFLVGIFSNNGVESIGYNEHFDLRTINAFYHWTIIIIILKIFVHVF